MRIRTARPDAGSTVGAAAWTPGKTLRFASGTDAIARLLACKRKPGKDSCANSATSDGIEAINREVAVP